MIKHFNNNDFTELTFPEQVEYNIVESFSRIIIYLRDKKVKLLILNFKQTTYITLPGAMYIFSFCHFLKVKDRSITVQIRDLRQNIRRYLMTLNFFSNLVSTGNLQIDAKILAEEELIIRKNEYSDKSIILPLKLISYNPDKSYFEDYTQKFINHFREFFLTITQFPVFNYTNNPDDMQELFEALFENIKNIFDHSKSEGYAAVHASRNLKGTTMAFFDIGIGISKSVLQSKPTSITSEIQALYWALKDGNSTRKLTREAGSSNTSTNQGHGLTAIRDFTTQKKGILTIRTGNFQLIYRKENWEERKANWFPGTQIIIYTPIL